MASITNCSDGKKAIQFTAPTASEKQFALAKFHSVLQTLSNFELKLYSVILLQAVRRMLSMSKMDRLFR